MQATTRRRAVLSAASFSSFSSFSKSLPAPSPSFVDNLARTSANHAPLSPIQWIERAAIAFPNTEAVRYRYSKNQSSSSAQQQQQQPQPQSMISRTWSETRNRAVSDDGNDNHNETNTSRIQMMVAAAPPPAKLLSDAVAAGIHVTHAYGLTETYGPTYLGEKSMSELLKSPFHTLYEELYPAVEWEDWGGYNSASLMGDADEEITTIRTGTVAFDMSPVVKYRIKGPDAEKFMNLLTTRQMDIKPGRVRYTCWCNANGKLIDDGTAFRIAEDEYMLCPGDRHPEHFKNISQGMNVTVEEATGEIASLTIQGKTSLSSLQKIGIQNLETLSPYSFREYDSPAGALRISRTGFFGDLGYELWMRHDQTEVIWRALLGAGVRPIGMVTLCNARLEAGMLIPGEGYDFEPASPDGGSPHPLERSPLEVGLGFLISAKKKEFVGREALLAEKERGARWALIGLELEGKKSSAHGDKVFHGGKEVGIITSGLYSLSLEQNIALASVDSSLKSLGTVFEVESDGGKVAATSVDKTFINPERKTQMPAPAL